MQAQRNEHVHTRTHKPWATRAVCTITYTTQQPHGYNGIKYGHRATKEKIQTRKEESSSSQSILCVLCGIRCKRDGGREGDHDYITSRSRAWQTTIRAMCKQLLLAVMREICDCTFCTQLQTTQSTYVHPSFLDSCSRARATHAF